MSIWNKKREEDLPPRPTAQPVTPAPKAAEVRREQLTVSSMSNPSFRATDSSDTRGAATIGKAVKVVGQIYSKEDLYVDGDVEGTIELLEHKLTIGPNGKVHSGIKAREVVALGSIQGNVEAADRIEIRKDARLVGDIRTARIIIEDGAYFKGSIDIVKGEPAKAPQRQQAAPATASNAQPQPAAAEAKR